MWLYLFMLVYVARFVFSFRLLSIGRGCSSPPLLSVAAPYLTQKVLSPDFLTAMVDHRGPHDIGTAKGVQYKKVLELYSAAEVSAMWNDWHRMSADLEAPSKYSNYHTTPVCICMCICLTQ